MPSELTPQETDAIRREAEEYARKVIPRNPMPEDKDFDLFEVYAESYAAALTSERLKHKAEIQAYRELVNKASNVLLLTEVDGTPVDGFRFREMILELKESLNNYKNNK